MEKEQNLGSNELGRVLVPPVTGIVCSGPIPGAQPQLPLPYIGAKMSGLLTPVVLALYLRSSFLRSL